MTNTDINPFILLFAVGSLFLELLKFLVASTKTFLDTQQKNNKKIIELENELDLCEDTSRALEMKIKTLESYILKQKDDIKIARNYARKYKKEYLKLKKVKRGNNGFT